MSTQPILITVRAIGANGDPLYGNGTSNFISNLAAVAQIIKTSLLLISGELWYNKQVGLPLWGALVSNPITNQAVALIYQNIILGVPYVTGITSLAVTYLPQSRSFSFAAEVQTQFGALTVGSPQAVTPAIAGPGLPQINTTSPLPSATIGQYYLETLYSSGGVAPYVWQGIGILPPGLSLNQSRGLIFGTPSAIGTYVLTLIVVDALGNESASVPFLITITA